MNHTNLHEYTFFLLNIKSCEIIEGKFSKRDSYDDMVKSGMTPLEITMKKMVQESHERRFLLKDNRDMTMCVEQYWFNKIDSTLYKIRERSKECSKANYKLQTEQAYLDGKENFFLIFSSLKKAEFVRKHLVLPVVLKKLSEKVEEQRKIYFDLVDEYGQIETLLK
jgi:hypothetical protein